MDINWSRYIEIARAQDLGARGSEIDSNRDPSQSQHLRS